MHIFPLTTFNVDKVLSGCVSAAYSPNPLSSIEASSDLKLVKQNNQHSNIRHVDSADGRAGHR